MTEYYEFGYSLEYNIGEEKNISCLGKRISRVHVHEEREARRYLSLVQRADHMSAQSVAFRGTPAIEVADAGV
jgi:hypothetical protein